MFFDLNSMQVNDKLYKSVLEVCEQDYFVLTLSKVLSDCSELVKKMKGEMFEILVLICVRRKIGMRKKTYY